MQSKLLEKVEELTLHMIEAGKRNNRLERENRDLQEQGRELRERIAHLEAGQVKTGGHQGVGNGDPGNH
jgi:FtsZ-binding cell division protein ZapB